MYLQNSPEMHFHMEAEKALGFVLFTFLESFFPLSGFF